MKWKRSKKGLNEMKQASSSAKDNHDSSHNRTSGSSENHHEDNSKTSSHVHPALNVMQQLNPGTAQHDVGKLPLGHPAHLLGHPTPNAAAMHHAEFIQNQLHLQQQLAHGNMDADRDLDDEMHESDMEEDDFLDVENNNSTESLDDGSNHDPNDSTVSSSSGGKYIPELLPEDLSKRRLLMTNHAVTAH